MTGGALKHEFTITADANTKVKGDDTLTLAALKPRQRVRVTGEKPATEIQILEKKAKKE